MSLIHRAAHRSDSPQGKRSRAHRGLLDGLWPWRKLGCVYQARSPKGGDESQNQSIVITSSLIWSHPASPLAEATLKRGSPPVSVTSRTIVNVEDRTDAYSPIIASSRQSCVSFRS